MNPLLEALSTLRELPHQQCLSERIHADLKARLQTGEIVPDVRLSDYRVAEQYGTSRAPAREAMLRLVDEGYLSHTRRGFTTLRLTADQLDHSPHSDQQSPPNTPRDDNVIYISHVRRLR